MKTISKTEVKRMAMNIGSQPYSNVLRLITTLEQAMALLERAHHWLKWDPDSPEEWLSHAQCEENVDALVAAWKREETGRGE